MSGNRGNSRVAITAATQRKMERVIHLAAGGALLVYVYAPVGESLEGVIRFMVLPILTLSGVAMWQMARIRRAVKRKRLART
jgi:hypothetical protein